MDDVIFFHPLLGRPTHMFRIVILPESVPPRIGLSDEWLQVVVHNPLVAGTIHYARKDGNFGCPSS